MQSISFNLYFFTASLLIISILIIGFILIMLSIKNKQFNEQTLFLKTLNEEKERTMQYVSMEIHDNFTQMLCLTRMFLHVINDHSVSENKKEIDAASRFIDELILVSHNMTNSLHPEYLTKNGLISTIQNEINWINSIKKTKIQLEQTGLVYNLNDIQNLMIFRIIQEAIGNSLKHANATDLKVHIEYKKRIFSLTVTDNGLGFNYENMVNEKLGLGLINFKKRAQLCGGELKVISKINSGTSIILTIPIT